MWMTKRMCIRLHCGDKYSVRSASVIRGPLSKWHFCNFPEMSFPNESIGKYEKYFPLDFDSFYMSYILVTKIIFI